MADAARYKPGRWLDFLITQEDAEKLKARVLEWWRRAVMALTEAEAALIRGMLKRGDRQQDIAAWFRCNSGRVAEINKGRRHPHVTAAPAALLPPPGPYHLAALASGEATTPGGLSEEQKKSADAAIAVLADFEARLLRELTTATHERRQTNELVNQLMRQQAELRRLLGALERPQTPRIGRRRPLGHD